MNRQVLREAARTAIIVVLVVTFVLTARQTDTMRSERDGNGEAAKTNAQSVGVVGDALADVCKAASAKEIAKTGRAKDCQLAKQGKINELVPVVEPPAQIVQRVSKAEIERVVDEYMRQYLTTLPTAYRAEMRAAVVEYFRQHPPPPGPQGKVGPPPSQATVASVVIDYLQKNPPKPGADGKPGAAGVSVVAVALDGCDLVFTYSDKTSNRVGPVCGERGPGPTAAELRAAIDSYCADQPGGTCEGKTGPAGYPTGWREPDGTVCTDPDGDHFYTCEAPPPPTSEPSGPPATEPTLTLPTASGSGGG